MKAVAIVIAVAVLCVVPAAAEPDIADRVLDYLYPHRVKRIPLPQPKPRESEPFVETLPPDFVTPDMIPPPVVPPQALPELPKVQPKTSPPKQADRSKPPPRKSPPPKQQLQPEAGFCFFPLSCAQVCEYARAGDSRRGTSCQNARGLACVRSTCPEVLKKKH